MKGEEYKLKGPKHLKCLLPNFDQDLTGLPYEHTKKLFFPFIRWISTKDTVSQLFLYNFENKSSTWYFNLLFALIAKWNVEFENAFLDKLGK